MSFEPSLEQVVGGEVLVRVEASNPGVGSVSGVVPRVALELVPAYVVKAIAGPVPAGPVALAPGQAETFVWTLASSAAGMVSVTAAVAGRDDLGNTDLVAEATGSISIVASRSSHDPLALTASGAALDRNVLSVGGGEHLTVRIVPQTSGRIGVRVFSASGRRVADLDGIAGSAGGQCRVKWYGFSDEGEPAARGVYLIHVKGGGLDELLKVIVR